MVKKVNKSRIFFLARISENLSVTRYNIACTSDCVSDGENISYGRKSADRTKPHFDVIYFVFLSTYFGNLEACYTKTFNIF